MGRPRKNRRLTWPRTQHLTISLKSLAEAKAQVRTKDYTAAIIDLCLSGGEGTEGLEVLDELHRQHPETVCILLTAYGSPWATAEASRRGAAFVADKPVRLAELQWRLQRLRGSGVP